MIKRINAIIAMATLALFIIHGVLGALNLMDIAPVVVKTLSYTMLSLVIVHALIGVYMTVKSVIAAVKTKAPYFSKNRMFWARRISGFLIMALIFFHLTAFTSSSGGVFRLVPFDAARLTAQLLLLLSVAVHIISNVKPALISFGIKKLKPKSGDILFFISAALLFMAAGFIIYYIRWQL